MSGADPLNRSHARAPGAGWPGAGEWWEALRWVYLTFTLLVLLALAGSFVPYGRVLREGHPWLPRLECPGCAFCGMTRSFCALSAGKWQEAARWNQGGPFLYAGAWLWLAGAGILAGRRLRFRRAARALPSHTSSS